MTAFGVADSFWRGAALGVPILLCLGCYNYVPTRTLPAPGRAVRAEMSEGGTAHLISQLGPGVTELEGMIISADTQGIAILVNAYITQKQGMLNSSDAVRLEPRHIGSIREKRINRLRSALFGASLTAGLYFAIELFSPNRRIFENEEPEDPGPPRVRSAVSPGFRIPFPF